ncbi:RecQ family ATP-dependent DNA helicase [Macrococcus equi]|uniref:RecQ family ATP-dependent DNA helicase n=1 Tax=Macrococcus equi TaxID=3395462 RepID=UPI0039BDADCB
MNALNNILKNTFKIDRLRENQREIIDEILRGADVLTLLPTGAGKSLTFQLPMLLLKKKTIVVSPLISLMEDQVMQLKNKRIKACCIHSNLDAQDKYIILRNIHAYDFIYCSPEWLSINGLELLKDYPCQTVVIDEAHCISEWGYEFRPHYLVLGEIINYYDAQVIALTATANNRVIQDIQQVLGKPLKILDYMYERMNIYYAIINCMNDGEKLKYIENILKSSGPTVIYFSSKKQVELVYQYLYEQHITVERYHADMTYEERMSVQQRFMQDEIQVICATNAFGMGVNKPNIRTVIHYHMPKSIFQFIQEIGRAGRDGFLAQSILLYSENDELIAYRLNEMNELNPDEIAMFYQGTKLPEEKQVLLEILSKMHDEPFIVRKIAQHQSMKRLATSNMLSYIHEQGCLTKRLKQLNQNNSLQLDQIDDESKQNNRCCSICNEEIYLKFNQSDYQPQKMASKALLNQLFNDLYDFT